MIALTRLRSRLVLIASLITVIFSMYGIVGSIVLYVEDGQSAVEMFRWFTTISNLLTGFSACMIIPFAVEGIRKKYFSYPRWVAMLHYSGMVCITVTMLVSVGFMSWVDPKMVFGGYNWCLHILCPAMVIISFYLVESGFHFKLTEVVITTLPAVLYMCVYAWQVAFVGKENGGWEDMYHILDYIPVLPAMLLFFLITFCTSLLIRWVSDKLTLKRRRRLMGGLWPKSIHPVEIKIEIFGYGRYMGKHADTHFVELPLELIRMIAEMYGLKTEELIRPYLRGFFDSVKDKKNHHDI